MKIFEISPYILLRLIVKKRVLLKCELFEKHVKRVELAPRITNFVRNKASNLNKQVLIMESSSRGLRKRCRHS